MNTILEYYLEKNRNLINLSIIKIEAESVADETRKHKSQYFPMIKSKHENERTNFRGSKDVNSRLELNQNGKPVNFLFSNENDSNEESSSDEVCNSPCFKN